MNKEQLTQRVWEQLNRLQFALYAIMFVGLYIFFSMLGDSVSHSKLNDEINDIRHAYEQYKDNHFNEQGKTKDDYYLLEVTYFTNEEEKYSWFYRTNEPLNKVSRYLLVRASDLEQFSHVDSFLWGYKWISSYQIFQDDLKDSNGAPIKWHPIKYKDIEEVGILDLITHSNDLFQPVVHMPSINNLIFIGAHKRNLTNGKVINFGAISYILKKKLKLNPSEIGKISKNSTIVINGQKYPVEIQDVTTQNFYYTKVDGDYTYIGIINFGLGDEFGLTDYATLSTTFSGARYRYSRVSKKFNLVNSEPEVNYFKSNFPYLHEMFYIYYEKGRNPKLKDLPTMIGQIIDRKEKISIPLIGLSFYKVEAGKLISIILCVLLIIQMVYVRRLQHTEYESIPLIEIPSSRETDYLLVRLIKIVMPLIVNFALIATILANHSVDIYILTAIVLTVVSLFMFFKTYVFSKTYWVLVRCDVTK